MFSLLITCVVNFYVFFIDHMCSQFLFSLLITCIINFCVLIKASSMCNFENYKICGYGQSKTDTFDWTRSSGRTRSSGTGPPSDHTYGTNNGK